MKRRCLSRFWKPLEGPEGFGEGSGRLVGFRPCKFPRPSLDGLKTPAPSKALKNTFIWLIRICIYSLNSLAVRVPHSFSKNQCCKLRPRIRGRSLVARLLGFPCKTIVFLKISAARFIKPLLFQHFRLPDLLNHCFSSISGCPIYTTNTFLLLFWTEFIKPRFL